MNIKRIVLILLFVSVITSVVLYMKVWGYPRQRSLETEASDDIRHAKLLDSYKKRLAAVPRQKHKPASSYKHIGPPLSTILDKNVNQSVKLILAWTKFFGVEEWIPKSMCEGSKICISTTSKDELPQSDGIVVHPRDLKGRYSLPTNLRPHQRLIYLIQESPHATSIDVGQFNGVFNWTSSHRRDSDSPYTFVWGQESETRMPEEQYRTDMDKNWSAKTKLVSAMISNCDTRFSNRLSFIADLKKSVHVDFYGKCGNLVCPRTSAECDAKMAQYKFYLAFENSNCRDYITEKVHNALLIWKAVPVVMGGADPGDYERILPPNSYIHVSGFNSASELADYLLLLDRNPHLYDQYQQWRKTHRLRPWNAWCDICTKLHDTSLPVQVYSDFKGWYQDDTCFS